MPLRAHSGYGRRFSVGLLLCVIFFTGEDSAAAQQRLGAGTLLVASGGLRDSNFRQAVVLLFDYGSHGAGGVVINRPTVLPLREVLSDGEGPQSSEHVVWRGGPVLPGGLAAIVGSEAIQGDQGLKVLNGVFMVDLGRALEELERASLGPDRIRAFAGHAGWSPGQLEVEIARGDWELLPGRPEWIFSSDPESLWHTLIELAALPAT